MKLYHMLAIAGGVAAVALIASSGGKGEGVEKQEASPSPGETPVVAGLAERYGALWDEMMVELGPRLEVITSAEGLSR